MNFRRKIATAIVCGIVAAGAGAQTIGNQSSRHTSAFSSGIPNGPLTIIDFSHPATAAGRMTSATFRWTTPLCVGAVKIKVLRRNPNLDLGTFTMIERGPFDATGSVNTVTLNPPIDILPGDYIGLTQFRSPGNPCGATHIAHSTPDQILLVASGDVQSGSFSTFRQNHGYEMNVIASAGTEVLSGVIAATGAAAGQNNSFFRTAVQLTNTVGVPITGRLVFHPAGQAGSASDPSFPFTLAANETKSYADIVTTMGRAGLGSIDVLTTSSVPPIVSARVYNDQGVNGTSGFTEEALRPSQALHESEQGFLQVPADLTKFRLNIGVRTLGAGATLHIRTRGPTGTTIGLVTKSYPANYFTQTTGADFTGEALVPGSSILVSVTQGSAFVYGGTTDNKTNDGNMQFAARR